MPAMFAGVGAQSIGAALVTVGVGVTTPADCYIGLGAHDTSDTIEIANPAGVLGCQYDAGNLRFFVEHVSSPAKGNDYPGVNHAGVKGLMPISPDVTLYAGASYAIPSEQLNGDPILISAGAETNGSIRLYGEYLMSVDRPSDGMLHGGVKFVF